MIDNPGRIVPAPAVPPRPMTDAERAEWVTASRALVSARIDDGWRRRGYAPGRFGR